MYINKTKTKNTTFGGEFFFRRKNGKRNLCWSVYRDIPIMFHDWEVDITTHENAEITNWVHHGFTVLFLDQPGWTWNKSSTRLQLINFPSTIPSFSNNKVLKLFWRLPLQHLLYGNTRRKLELPPLGQMNWNLGRQPRASWAKGLNTSRTDNGGNKSSRGNYTGKTRPDQTCTVLLNFQSAFVNLDDQVNLQVVLKWQQSMLGTKLTEAWPLCCGSRPSLLRSVVYVTR